jgi:hypothetical protein
MGDIETLLDESIIGHAIRAPITDDLTELSTSARSISKSCRRRSAKVSSGRRFNCSAPRSSSSSAT